MRHGDVVDHDAGELAGGAGAHEQVVLVVLAIFATADAGSEEAQVPGWAHAAVAHDAAEEFDVSRDEVAGVLRLVGEGDWMAATSSSSMTSSASRWSCQGR